MSFRRFSPVFLEEGVCTHLSMLTIQSILAQLNSPTLCAQLNDVEYNLNAPRWGHDITPFAHFLKCVPIPLTVACGFQNSTNNFFSFVLCLWLTVLSLWLSSVFCSPPESVNYAHIK